MNATGAGGLLAEDRIVTATGSYTSGATASTSGLWVAQAIIFRGAAAADTQAPTAPTNLSATAASSSQINLSWTRSTDNVGVTGYRVERCQGAGCSTFTQIGTPSGTTFNDTGLSASTSYTYRVRAQDAVPNLGSYSSTASATTQAGADTQAPTAPTNLSATSVSSSQVNLSWTAATDNVAVTGYRVERCQGAGCSSFAQVGTPSGTTFNDTGLSASTSYTYRVRAQDAVPNLGSYSSTASATTQSLADAQAPTVPTNLSATVVSSTQVNLSWTAATDNVGVTGYRLERCTGAGCSNFAPVTTPSGTSYSDTSLSGATVYNYRVLAKDAANNTSAASTVSTATTPPVSGTSANITYGYDANGRLVQVASPTYNAVQGYSYDAAGNILSTTATTLTTLSISGLSVAQGAAGTQITIYGSGFSSVPGSNVVTFNGVAATVVSATATQLVVIVPSGATSGVISVTVAGTTVQSAPFSVNPALAAPTISGFSPSIGFLGTAITVSGAGFESVPQGNKLWFGRTAANITAGSTTSVSATVPIGAGSGKIRLTNPRGVALSAADFIIVPPGYSLSDVAVTGRLAGTGDTHVSIGTAGKIAIELFDANAGDLLTIGVSSLSMSACTIKVYAPDGSPLTSGSVSASGQGVQLPKLPTTGTYSIVLDPGASTGSIDFSLVPPLTGALTVDASPTTITVTPPGRRARFTFTGSSGTYVTLALTGVTIPAGTVSIIQSNGSVLSSAPISTSGTSLSPQLPANGTYTVLIDPEGSVGGSASVALLSSSAPTLPANTNSQISVTGQSPASLTFRASAGQYFALSVSEQNGSISSATIVVAKPDGTELTSSTFTGSCSSPCGNGFMNGRTLINLGPLPVSGTYVVRVQNITQSSNVSTTLGLSLMTPLAGTLNIGTTSNVSTSMPGQGMQLTFAGTAGQLLSLAVRESLSTIEGATVTVLRPDGSKVAASTLTTSCGVPCSTVTYTGHVLLNMEPLLMTGTYTVLVQQASANANSSPGVLSFSLSEPVSATLPIGAVSTVATNLPGQRMRLTFAGTAGQYLALAIEELNSTITGATVSALGPDGTQLASSIFTTCSAPACPNGYTGVLLVNIPVLPLTGTYTVIVQQASAEQPMPGQLRFTLSAPVTPTINPGVPANVSVSLPGQGISFAFNGVAGQYNSLAITELAGGTIPGGEVVVLNPDGSTLTTGAFNWDCGPCQTYAGSWVLNMGPLPTAGTYKVVIRQIRISGGELNLLFANAVNLSLPVGQPTAVALTQPGQGIRADFTATAGQTVVFGVSATSSDLAGATITIRKPDGSVVATGTLTGTNPGPATASVNTGPLPTTGSYHAAIQQSQYPRVGTLTVSWSGAQASTTTLVANPSPARPDQSVTFTASVTGSSPTGTVRFIDGSTLLGTAAVSGGQASIVVPPLSLGNHGITASYGGDTVNAPSSINVNHLVANPASTTTTVASNRSFAFVSEPVTFTASLTGSNPSGTVTFYDGSTAIGTGAVSNRQATFTTAALAVGNHSITASYGGDAVYSPSTSAAITQTVSAPLTTAAAVTSSPNPSIVGYSVALTASVTGGSGTLSNEVVTFKDGATVLGTAPLSYAMTNTYQATLNVSTLPVGAHSITAVFAGNVQNLPSTSPAYTHTVSPPLTTTTTVTTPYGTVAAGIATSFTATVSTPVPSNLSGLTVTFYDGGTSIGSASLSYSSVNQHQATLNGVTFSAGTHSITAAFAGNVSNLPSTSAPLSLSVTAPITPTVTWKFGYPTPTTIPSTATVQVRAAVTPALGLLNGLTIKFMDGSTVLGTGTLAYGTMNFEAGTTVPLVGVGTHSLTAQFDAQGPFLASSSPPATVTVTAPVVSTTTWLAGFPAPNPATTSSGVNYKVRVTTPTLVGLAPTQVKFYDGATLLGTANMQYVSSSPNVWQAELYGSPLAVGTHSIRAEFLGGNGAAPSTSPTVNVVVN